MIGPTIGMKIDSTTRRIRSHGPYGPQSSGGKTRCQIASVSQRLNQHHQVGRESVGTARRQNLTRPASTSTMISCISAQVGKNVFTRLNSTQYERTFFLLGSAK